MAKATAAKSMNKSTLLNEIAEASGLTRKQVTSVFDSLTNILKGEVGKKKDGVLNVMRLVKVYKVQKPAQPAGKRPNPFKPGEMMEVKAKPARNVIKVRPLKDLKSMV